MGNIYLEYLEKQAAKVVSRQESSMVAKRDAERAKREAAKDKELTPAQKEIKAKQEANAQAAREPTVVTKPKPGANARERLDNVLADQKAARAPTEHFTSANTIDYAKPVIAKPAPNTIVPKSSGPENRSLSLMPKETSTTPAATEAAKAAAPKVGPQVEHQTADHLSAVRRLMHNPAMKKVGLGLAGLSAVGAVGYGLAGHDKAAENNDFANKDTAVGGLTGYLAHSLLTDLDHPHYKHGLIPAVGLGVAAGALHHVQKERDELKKAAALKKLGL